MDGKTVVKVIGKASSVRELALEWEGGYVFTADPCCRDYDWLLVYDELPVRDEGTFSSGREKLFCPRSRTILATWEPPTIKHYSRAYLGQFGHLLTNLPLDRRARISRGYYRWLNDRSYGENLAWTPQTKTRLISAVCSAKAMRWTKHHARIELLKHLVAEVPEAEWYGHDVRSFDRKCDVMDAYKYHVAIENYIAPHYWTEKLSDAFLCECLPFYAGAPDLADDFPAESFIPIPIDNPAEAVAIINDAIAGNEYEKRREAIAEARHLVLTKYNFWAQTVALIEDARARGLADGGQAASGDALYARKVLRKRNPLTAMEDGLFHFRQYLGGLIGGLT